LDGDPKSLAPAAPAATERERTIGNRRAGFI
jgi:hypothetical protein